MKPRVRRFFSKMFEDFPEVEISFLHTKVCVNAPFSLGSGIFGVIYYGFFPGGCFFHFNDFYMQCFFLLLDEIPSF